MKDHIVTTIIGILTLIIGALLGYYVDIFKDEQKNKIKYVDLRVDTSKAVLRKLTTKDNKHVTLSWGGNEIDSVSKVTVKLYNFSNTDFEKVPLFIDLQASNKEKIEVIDVQGRNEAGVESHSKIKNYPQSGSLNDIKYGFDIGILNRVSEYDPSYTISFLIKGTTLPKVLATINKKGVKSREFSVSRLFKDSPWRSVLFILGFLVLIGAYVLFIVYLVKHGKKRTLKRDAELVQFLNKELKDHGVAESEVDEKAKQLVQKIRFFTWQKIGWLDKKIFHSEPPNLDELENELTRTSNGTKTVG